MYIIEKRISSDNAAAAAVEYAGLRREEVCCTLISRANGLYEIAFRTDWLKYDCYVDAQSAQVLGFSFEPIPDAERAEYHTGGAFRKTYGNIIAASK